MTIFLCTYTGDIMTEVIVNEKSNNYDKTINFYYAGFWIRLVAFAIDMALVLSISGIIGRLLGTEIELGLGITSTSLIYWLTVFLYFTLTTYITNGQTLGKMILNIRVISLDGKRLALFQVVSRETFGRYVQNKFMILYAIVGINPNKQSLIDMLADTVVVKIDEYEYVKSCEGVL